MTNLIKNRKSPISLQSQVNRLFENFFSDDFELPTLADNNLLSPAINVKENSKEIIINAELPGVAKDDLAVTIDNNVLIIKGEKKQAEERKEDNYVIMESSYGKFQRAINLNDLVDINKAQSSFKKGILTINLPKKPEAIENTKKLDINEED